MPSAYTSLAGVVVSPRICSGDAYPGLMGNGTSWRAMAASSGIDFESNEATPKSSSFATPSAVTKTFEGFKSQ